WGCACSLPTAARMPANCFLIYRTDSPQPLPSPTMKLMPGALKIWLSANDTYRFASGYYGTGRWPCSILSGHACFVEFASNGDLVDYSGPEDVSNAELMACVSANLTKRTAKERARFAGCIR